MPEPTLFAAVASWFASDSDLTTAFPGGFLSGRAGVAQAFPHARFGWRKPDASLSVEDEEFLITLATYAMSADQAEDVGELLLAKYLDEARPALTFTDKRGRVWREAARLEREAIGPEWIETITAVDGGAEGDVWRYRVPVTVRVVRA